MNTNEERQVSAMSQRLLGVYLKLLRRIWSRTPDFVRSLPPALALGRHIDGIVRQVSTRSQHFTTFFLRNRPELELLRRITDKLSRGARLNMTILACSKGAEVYSKAWVVRLARPDIDLHIHAIDISTDIIDFAARGVYSLREADDRDITTEDAVLRGRGAASIPSSDKDVWIFRNASQEEIDSMFELHGDVAIVRPWLRDGITWRAGDAFDHELPSQLGPQDIVVANSFLCHMMPRDAERCLRNIGRFVKPDGYLFVYGIDLDVRERIAREQGWIPVTDLIREIHDGDDMLRCAWPLQYWAIEPLDEKRPDWQLRYASVFQIGKASPKILEPIALKAVTGAAGDETQILLETREATRSGSLSSIY